MNRRELLRSAGVAIAGLKLRAQENVERATRGTPAPRIKDVSVIATAPQGVRLVVVKVTTDQDGLYGYGCGTFTQRADLVVPAVEKYLKPFLIGKAADRIEDAWQAMYNSSYWRNGPVLNNAISGVDGALWDIMGRRAGMPVYELLGGKCREAVDVYRHASGAEISQTIEQARKFMADGFRNIRVQVGVPGMEGYGSARGDAKVPSLHQSPVFEPDAYIRRAMQLFEACRKELGEDVQLLHDVHERVHPIQAVRFAKEAERFHLLFLEDALSPEDIAYFRMIRQQCATQLAMGELFSSPHEWNPLIAEHLIDFIRIHPSMAGGLTPCRKIAAMCETFGVRTAWHGPTDLSPIGVMCNLSLDLACPNFGVQECSPFNERTEEVFRGCPKIKDGYWWVEDRPGWGIEVDEKLAAKYPFGTGERGNRQLLNGGWGEIRRRDGTIIKQ